MSIKYRGRVIDDELTQRMAASGAVVIEGPKACGKTETASRKAATVHRLLADPALQSVARTAPTVLLEEPRPILLDEWQVVPNLWNVVKEAVDATAQKGQFLLTGSATPHDDVNRHTGAGRMATLRMRPMSLFETGHSTGLVSLSALFNGDQLSPTANLSFNIPDLVERIVVGGWPMLLNSSVPDAQAWLDAYLDNLATRDMAAMGTGRDPARVKRLLAALARGNGTAISTTTLHTDVNRDDSGSRNTTAAHLTALERLMLTEDVPAWNPHMRAKTRLRTQPTRFMVDPSLAVAALGQGPDQLLRDLNATGFHFENLVVRDLRVYSQPLSGTLSNWRDANGNEVDAILNLRDGRWAAFEVKLGEQQADEGAKSLLRFEGNVDTSKSGSPMFKAVIAGTGVAHVRPDGVLVIPISTLGP